MQRHELEVFLHLAETLHFGKTSRSCNMSPSALSRLIQRLEEELGYRLLDRDNRSATLTEAGARYRDYARTVVEGYRNLTDSLEEMSGEVRGEVRIYASVTACYTILPRILSSFRLAFPGVQIHLRTGDAASAIRTVIDGDADVTVAARPDLLPGQVEFRDLTTTPLVFVRPSESCDVREMLMKSPVTWEQVPMILAEAGLSRSRLEAWFRHHGTRPLIYAEVSGKEAILAMVGLGCGAGVVPSLVLEASPMTNVEPMEVTPTLEPYQVGLCVNRRSLSLPAVREFWDLIPRHIGLTE